LTERDLFQRKDHFARLVHGLDLALETRRRDHRTEVTVGIDNYSYPVCDGYPADPGDKGVSLTSPRADADRSGLGCTTRIADVDIVTACGEVDAGVSAHCDVVVPIVVQ